MFTVIFDWADVYLLFKVQSSMVHAGHVTCVK